MQNIFQLVIESSEPTENATNQYIVLFDSQLTEYVICILPISNKNEPPLLN